MPTQNKKVTFEKFTPIIGIYKISNIKNNMSYIGQSTNIIYRLWNHADKLTRGTHINSKLQEDINLDGFSVFVVEILEVCKKEDLLKREEYHIITTKERLYNQLSGFLHTARFRIKQKSPHQKVIEIGIYASSK